MAWHAPELVAGMDRNTQGSRLVTGRILDSFHIAMKFKPAENSIFCSATIAPLEREVIQNIYDPVGNIAHIQDDAQDSVYFGNKFIEPSNDYVYDALYRLIEGTGRENPANPSPPNDRLESWPSDSFPSGVVPRNYTQRFAYDEVGNFKQVNHLAGTGIGWTRNYLTKPANNRLDRTWYGSTTGDAVTYYHDTHGNMLNLNRIAPPSADPGERWGLAIRWDWRDMIGRFDCGGGGVARYQYGIDKQRSRKQITRLGGVVEDRIYLGGYELYRRSSPHGVVEEIESLHLFEGEQRVLLVDDVITSSKGTQDPRPDGLVVKAQTLFRYQYSNHLGSACLELDDKTEIISYEEYHPYGTSAYRAMRSGIEAPPKRYRYTGMERDEESGLSYHTARHYSPSLGRWMSADPTGLSDGPCRYLYCKSNPISFTDRVGSLSDPTLVTAKGISDLTGELAVPATTEGAFGYAVSLAAAPLVAALFFLLIIWSIPKGRQGGADRATSFAEQVKAERAAPPPTYRHEDESVLRNRHERAIRAANLLEAGEITSEQAEDYIHTGYIYFRESHWTDFQSAPAQSSAPPAADAVPSSATPPKDLKAAFRRDQVKALRSLPEDDPVRIAFLRADQKGLRTGRGRKDSIGLEAGHLDAASSKKAERLALQDADTNGLAGRTIESRNSRADRASGSVLISRFDAVEIRPGVFVETKTLDLYIRLKILPPSVKSTAKPSPGWTWKPKDKK